MFLIENSKPLILIASKTCLMSLIKVVQNGLEFIF